MKSFFRLYRRYLKIIHRHKWKYRISVFLFIVLLLLYNASIFAIGSLIDNVQTDPNSLGKILLLITVILALPIVFEPITLHLKTRLLAEAINHTTAQVYKNVLSLDYSYHVNRQTGKLISMIIQSPDVITMFLWQFEWFSLENLAALIIPVVLIGLIQPEIALAIVILFILLLPFIFFAVRFNVNSRKVMKEFEYDRNTAIVDGLSNFETVRSFGSEMRETAILQERLNACEHALNKYQNTFRYIDFTSRTLGIILFVVAAILTTYYFNLGLLSLGAVVIIVTYLIQITSKLMSFVFGIRDVLKNLPIAEDFFELMDATHEIQEDPDPQYLHNAQGEVAFKNVTFNYPDNTKLIDNLSLLIEPGQNVALVGPSGGGKSTITRLLMRYYDVTAGDVRIDGVNVQKLAIDSLRELIGIVPQEPVLFNRSILYNVGYALENIDDESEEHKDVIVEACKRAHVHDFIESLPNGYSTFVGERGVKLSGGQKQRLAIARLLIKNPKIIIFDEATSMLDSESERAIQKAFRELSRDKTTIIIAHRLSTIIHCDKIFVIDKGKVVESGNHEELVKQKGVYANLWDIQSGGFVAG